MHEIHATHVTLETLITITTLALQIATPAESFPKGPSTYASS
jgi:hypothetical protein